MRTEKSKLGRVKTEADAKVYLRSLGVRARGLKPILLTYLPKQKGFMQNCDEVRYSAYIGGFGSG